MQAGRHAAWLAILVVLAAALWAGIALFLQHTKRQTLEDARAMRANLARVVAAHQDASMRAIDSALRHLRERWLADRPGFDAAVREQESYLQREQVVQVAVLDQTGRIAFSRLPAPPGANFADRAYFQAQRDARADEMIAGGPVFGRVTGRWAIQFTRRLATAEGSFAGLIVVAVPPPPLERFLERIDLGEGGVITLAGADGVVLARTADYDRAARVPLAGLPPADPAAPPAGDFAGPGLDGIGRLFTYQKLDHYPFAVLVGQRAEAVLKPYFAQRDAAVTAGVVATLLMLALGWLLGELRRRERAALEERERTMLELHDGVIQALYAIGMSLEGSRRLLAAEPGGAAREIGQAVAGLSAVMQDLRSFIAGGFDPGPVGVEFARHIEALLPAAQPGVPAFSVEIDERAAAALTPQQAAHLLRIAREAVSNVLRHAGASRAAISLRWAGERLLFEATDDGRGVPAGGEPSGLGLRHIETRARKLRGKASIAAKPGAGTRVAVDFPRAA